MTNFSVPNEQGCGKWFTSVFCTLGERSAVRVRDVKANCCDDSRREVYYEQMCWGLLIQCLTIDCWVRKSVRDHQQLLRRPHSFRTSQTFNANWLKKAFLYYRSQFPDQLHEAHSFGNEHLVGRYGILNQASSCTLNMVQSRHWALMTTNSCSLFPAGCNDKQQRN